MKAASYLVFLFTVGFLSQPVFAEGYALFDASTDNISVMGNSVIGTAATFEARVKPTSAGFIFNEWSNAREDKSLAVVSPQTIYGYLYKVAGVEVPLLSNTAVTFNTWHHIAYVYDGSEERLYLDGVKVGSRLASGDAGDYSGSPAAIGAIYRDNHIVSSFQGLIDTVRVSTVARYFGDSFAAPTGDLTSDSSTNLLYNFNEAPGSTTVYDLSGNGRNGYFGRGFSGATSPTLVPEPATLALLALGGVLLRKRIG